MISLETAKTGLENSKSLAQEGISKANANKQLRIQCAALAESISALEAEVGKEVADLEVLSKAAVILANVSEECTNQILNSITGVINKALLVLFPNDPKTIEISRSMYRDTHPQYNLVLKTKAGVARSFNQSGTGLAQVISFLFTTCLIDSRNGRKILVMDELLNGLHPSAKGIVASLMIALSTRQHDPFQFVCVEYGMDLGKQYEIAKTATSGGLSTATVWSGDKPYYASQTA